jgi:alpha-L-rhamnosidase
MKIYKPIQIRTEFIENPITIDIRKPKFSWILQSDVNNEFQKAYRIIVSDSIEELSTGHGNLWDTGKVVSSEMSGIEYSGKELVSFKEYFWAVKFWNKDDIESDFSDHGKFSTSLLDQNDWNAKWLTKDYSKSSEGIYTFGKFEGDQNFTFASYFRKEAKIKDKKIKHAKAFISGLGYYEFIMNGKKVGDIVLDSPQSDYEKTSYYSSYDIKNLLKSENAFCVILGNGRHVKSYGYSYPKFILQVMIEFTDGELFTIVSDGTWKVSFGPLRENGLYFGEYYDARLELPGWDYFGYNDSGWEKAIITNGSRLLSQKMPPIKITNYLKPKKIFNPKPGIFVFDFEQNFSGWVKLFVKGPKGTKVHLRFAENLSEDFMINTNANIDADANDIYILKGEGVESYEPRFTYHGFRYVEITGFPGVPSMENITGCFIHSSVPNISSFYCSNEMINKIHGNILWGQLSNMMSIPTDCPQRNERQGWMGDAALSVEEAIYNFDTINFHKKYLEDIRDAQFEDGSLTDISPYYLKHLHPADPAWGTAYITIVHALFTYYNDLILVKDHFPTMKKYIEFLNSIEDDGILKNIGKFGDWCPPGSVVPKNTSMEFTSTWFYIHDVSLMIELAKAIGLEKDSEYYKKLFDSLVDKFNKRFLKNGFYESLNLSPRPVEHFPSQTSFILPLFLHMAPEDQKEKVLSYLIDSVVKNHDYHVDTGILGTRYFFEVLSMYGYDEIAYKVASQKTYPGFGYMIGEGATTIWERWEKLTNGAMNSHNHIMFGTVDSWFYRIIAGVRCLAPGWTKIGIQPKFLGDLKFAAARVGTIKGDIECSWQKTETEIKLNVKIPVGSVAEIHLPFTDGLKFVKMYDEIIFDQKFKKNNLISEIISNEKEIGFSIGSGCYEFVITK